MKLKQLLKEDDAVSPVIGVILMVAITVILAAVIATFVLGLGESVSDTAPNANFQFEYDNSTGAENVTITHTSGPAIDAGSLSIKGAGIDEGWDNRSSIDSSDEVSAGDSRTVSGVTTGERISVIWSAEGDSATLANFDVPQ